MKQAEVKLNLQQFGILICILQLLDTCYCLLLWKG